MKRYHPKRPAEIHVGTTFAVPAMRDEFGVAPAGTVLVTKNPFRAKLGGAHAAGECDCLEVVFTEGYEPNVRITGLVPYPYAHALIDVGTEFFTPEASDFAPGEPARGRKTATVEVTVAAALPPILTKLAEVMSEACREALGEFDTERKALQDDYEARIEAISADAFAEGKAQGRKEQAVEWHLLGTTGLYLPLAAEVLAGMTPEARGRIHEAIMAASLLSLTPMGVFAAGPLKGRMAYSREDRPGVVFGRRNPASTEDALGEVYGFRLTKDEAYKSSLNGRLYTYEGSDAEGFHLFADARLLSGDPAARATAKPAWRGDANEAFAAFAPVDPGEHPIAAKRLVTLLETTATGKAALGEQPPADTDGKDETGTVIVDPSDPNAYPFMLPIAGESERVRYPVVKGTRLEKIGANPAARRVVAVDLSDNGPLVGIVQDGYVSPLMVTAKTLAEEYAIANERGRTMAYPRLSTRVKHRNALGRDDCPLVVAAYRTPDGGKTLEVQLAEANGTERGGRIVRTIKHDELDREYYVPLSHDAETERNGPSPAQNVGKCVLPPSVAPKPLSETVRPGMTLNDPHGEESRVLFVDRDAAGKPESVLVRRIVDGMRLMLPIADLAKCEEVGKGDAS